MPVTFIIGRARSGKTHYCLDRITRACAADPLGPPVIFLVPEQATYSMEKALLTHGPLDGFTRAQVMSFTRLEQFLFARGPAPGLPHLSPTHRDILVTLLVSRERRRNPDSLVSATGMEDALADFVTETKQYAASPDDLRRAAGELRRKKADGPAASTGLLEAKLGQLAALIEQFNAITRTRFQDPADTLAGLAQTIRTSELLQGAEVYVDGFIGLTPVEEKVLAALAQRAKSLHIALPGDPPRVRRLLRGEPLRRHAVFHPVEETLRRIERILSENGVELGETVYLDNEAKGAVAPALEALEREFFSRGNETASAAGVIEFHEVETPRDEARLAVEILARWMKDRGWRPGEVGIFTRDLETYAPHLNEAFAALRIPHFIDRHEPLETHPLVLGIQTLIRAALQPTNQAHLINLAKSGFLPITRRQADLLEYHVRQHPRPMKQWYSDTPWTPPPGRSPFSDEDELHFDEEEDFDATIDHTRRVVAGAVRALREPLFKGRDEGSFRDFLLTLTRAISNFVDVENDDADSRILRRIGELFGEALDAAGDEVLTWELAGDLVMRTLGRLSLPRIPPMLGEVFVGQADRSRQPRLRGVVVLGLCEGSFPRVGSNMTLLNDQERDALEGMGLDLRPNSRRQFERETFFGYRAFTTATDCLALCRARGQGDGAATPASPFWLDAMRIFGEKAPNIPPELLHPTRCWRARELAAAAVRLIDETHLAGPRATLRASKLFEDPAAAPLRDEVSRVLAQGRWRNEAALPAESLAMFLEHRLRLSVSQLEAFSRCPFQHFIAYLLRPRELMQPRFEARDAGNYTHAVLRNFTRLLRERGLVAHVVEDEQFEALFAEAAEAPAQRIRRSGLIEEAAGEFLFNKLHGMVRRVARWLVDSFVELPFRPVAEEVRLGHAAEAPLAPLKLHCLDAPWEFEVRGQIDRVDRLAFETTDGGEILVVDYKLRPRRFQYHTWEGGENLQLPVYLLAVDQNAVASGGARAAGGLYLDIVPKDDDDAHRRYSGIMRLSTALRIFPSINWQKVPFMEGSHGDPREQPRGWGTVITDEEFEELLSRTHDMVGELGRRIVNGDVRCAPSRYGTTTACGHCGYQPVCRMDYRVNQANVKMARDRRVILAELRGMEAALE